MTRLMDKSASAGTTPASLANGEQHFLLADVDWPTYLAIGKVLAERPGLRLTYDRGNLELMTISPKHEIFKKHLGRMVEITAEELNKPFTTAGSMTFQKEEIERGLEADDCFWLDHEPQMRGKTTWDLRLDPPPDLALEIEVSRTVLSRLDIYAALQIPEVWCTDGATVQAFRLQPDQSYLEVAASIVFPGIVMKELTPFLQALETQDLLTVIRSFREWLRSKQE